MRLSVVIPTLNEAEGLAATLQQAQAVPEVADQALHGPPRGFSSRGFEKPQFLCVFTVAVPMGRGGRSSPLVSSLSYTTGRLS